MSKNYFAVVAILAIFLSPAAFAQSTGDCRTETMDFAGRPESSVFCLGADGVWRAQRHRIDNRDDTDADDQADAPLGQPHPAAAYAPPAPPAAPARRASTTPLERELDMIVRTDSGSWSFNRYDAGSMINVKVLARTRKGAPTSLYGEYTYNNGAPGWVKVTLKGDKVGCLMFWDDQVCRALGQSLSRRFAADIARASARAPRGGGSGGSGSNSDADWRAEQNYQFERDRQANQAIQDQVDRASAPPE